MTIAFRSIAYGRASSGSFSYAYRAGAIDQDDNRSLRSAFELQTPIVYFRALAPGQYWVLAPAFVTADIPAARMVALDSGLPVQDMQPGGLASPADVRAYATGEARCARSTTSRSTAICSGSTPGACSTSPAACCVRSMGRCSRLACRAFHGGRIALPRRPEDRTDPRRLELRFERFERASA